MSKLPPGKVENSFKSVQTMTSIVQYSLLCVAQLIKPTKSIKAAKQSDSLVLEAAACFKEISALISLAPAVKIWKTALYRFRSIIVTSFYLPEIKRKRKNIYKTHFFVDSPKKFV